MTRAVALCVATLAVVAVTWWWLGRPVDVPPVAADPGRIQCVSYAPFRGNDSPLEEATRVSARDIEEDLAKLARLTDCVRTYSTENGLDQVPAAAKRLGLKVIQGLWLGSDRKKNRVRIDATVALAKQYRDTITAIVVGNEVLLRGEARRLRHHASAARGQSGDRHAGDLCRRMGILAAQSRARGSRRFHHHPYSPVLGGFPDFRRAGRRSRGT